MDSGVIKYISRFHSDASHYASGGFCKTPMTKHIAQSTSIEQFYENWTANVQHNDDLYPRFIEAEKEGFFKRKKKSTSRAITSFGFTELGKDYFKFMLEL